MTKYENNESLYWLQKFSEEILSSVQPGNRYICLDRIIKSIKAKKGWYSVSERITWMTFLYMCLTAPDFCFSKNTNWYTKNKAINYEYELEEFADKLEFEITGNSCIYTYLDCVRDYLKKLSDKITDHHLMADDLHKHLMIMLEKYKRKYPSWQVTCEQYKQVLDKIFKEEDGRLNHPIFFLFLPYHLFIELAKCEGVISNGAGTAKADGSDRINAFIIPELQADTLNWVIRKSPLQFKGNDVNEDCVKRLLVLYERIERTLCKRILKRGYHSIGEAAQQAIWAYPKDPLMEQLFSPSRFRKTSSIEPQELNEDNEYQELERLSDQEQLEELKELGELDEQDALEDEEDARSFQKTHATPFSVPLWKYHVWAMCLHNVFGVGLPEVSKDLHRLFSLSFRPSTRQAQKEMSEIKGQYQNHKMRSRRKDFYLSDLMDALCIIYNPALFQTIDPFEDQNLSKAVDLLTDFMTAINILDYVDADADTAQERWINLLRQGYPPYHEWVSYDLSDHFLINPNRVLVQAIFTRTIAEEWGGNAYTRENRETYFRGTVFYEPNDPNGEFDASMEMIQEAIHTTLNSPKTVLRDVSAWGGIKVIEDKNVASCNWLDAMRIWEFWHPDRFLIYAQISLSIQKSPKRLDSIVERLPEPCTKPVKLNLRQIDIWGMEDFTNAPKLHQRKQEIITLVKSLLPNPLQDALGVPDDLDDFQYAILLYILFSAVRKRMLSKAYEQYMKLLLLQ